MHEKQAIDHVVYPHQTYHGWAEILHIWYLLRKFCLIMHGVWLSEGSRALSMGLTSFVCLSVSVCQSVWPSLPSSHPATCSSREQVMCKLVAYPRQKFAFQSLMVWKYCTFDIHWEVLHERTHAHSMCGRKVRLCIAADSDSDSEMFFTLRAWVL